MRIEQIAQQALGGALLQPLAADAFEQCKAYRAAPKCNRRKAQHAAAATVDANNPRLDPLDYDVKRISSLAALFGADTDNHYDDACEENGPPAQTLPPLPARPAMRAGNHVGTPKRPHTVREHQRRLRDGRVITVKSHRRGGQNGGQSERRHTRISIALRASNAPHL